MTILSRINAIIGAPVTESRFGDVLGSVLKDHGIKRDDTEHILRGVADHHGIPKELVPQAMHHFLQKMGARGEYTPGGRDASRDMAMNEYSVLGGGSEAYEGHRAFVKRAGPASSHVMEGAVDQARSWHSLATHKHGRDALNFGLLASSIDKGHEHEEYDVGLSHFAARDKEALAHGAAMSKAALGGEGEFEDHDHAAHEYLVSKMQKYNPMRKDSWLHSVGIKKDHDFNKAIEKHDAADDDTDWAVNDHLDAAHEALASLVGHKIPYKPDAEHTDERGTTYRGYTLDTPEKANDRCWGAKFCIATPGHAESMNKMYHGGTYKTAHIITKVGENGEHIHAAYLPEMLPGEKHANPEQAVRNSGNNGAVTGEAFHKIHPLLSKLDGRIDGVASHYRNDTV